MPLGPCVSLRLRRDVWEFIPILIGGRIVLALKEYRWCSGCRVGHPLDGDVCPDWLTALRARDAVLQQRRYEWRRSHNRAQRWRKCITCDRRYDAGPPRRGRPSETCSTACAEIRDNDLRKLRHSGVSSRRRRPLRGLQTRGALRASPEVEAFLQAFPDGWSYEGFPTAD